MLLSALWFEYVYTGFFFGPLYCTTQNKSLTGLLEKKFDFTSSWVLQQMTIHKLLKSTHEPEKKIEGWDLEKT